MEGHKDTKEGQHQRALAKGQVEWDTINLKHECGQVGRSLRK